MFGFSEILSAVENHHEALTLSLGSLGGGAALWRYFKSERQAQAKTAADLIRAFAEDSHNRSAMHLLDYFSGVVRIRDEEQTREIEFTEDSVIEALRNSRADPKCQEKPFTLEERLIRNVFDHFLSQLEMFDFLIEGKVINKKDFGPYFSYWIKRIGLPPQSRLIPVEAGKHLLRKPAFRKAFWLYVECFEFKRVPGLIEKLYTVAMKAG